MAIRQNFIVGDAGFLPWAGHKGKEIKSVF